MPAKRTNPEVQCEFFKWILFKRKGVYFADGRSNRIKLGRYTLGNLDMEAARRALFHLDLKMAVSKGMADPDRLRRNPAEGLTLDSGFEIFMSFGKRPKALGGTTESTKSNQKSHWGFFKRYAQTTGIQFWHQVNKLNLANFATWRSTAEAGPLTVFFSVGLVKQVLDFLIREKKVPASCKFDLNLKKPKSNLVHCYTQEEYRAILERCHKENGLSQLKLIATVLAHTGMRISELFKLKWSDIDFNYDVIHIEDEHGISHKVADSRSTKSKKSREVPIHSEVRLALESIKGPKTGRVFKGRNGGRICYKSLKAKFVDRVIQPLAARFPGRPGKPSFADGRFHTFRHFFCSRCAQEGVPEVVVQGWLGHSSSAITRLYYHQNRQVSVDWMSRVNLAGSGEGSTPSCTGGSLVGGRTLKGRKNQAPSRGKAG